MECRVGEEKRFVIVVASLKSIWSKTDLKHFDVSATLSKIKRRFLRKL